MKRLPVRCTVRQMMVAVALVAILLGVVIRRWNYCLRMAAWHAQEEARVQFDRQSARSRLVLFSAFFIEERHAALRSAYQRVAARPWESLPDDPYLDKPVSSNPIDPNSPKEKDSTNPARATRLSH
jgi:hypothetical protein